MKSMKFFLNFVISGVLYRLTQTKTAMYKDTFWY